MTKVIAVIGANGFVGKVMCEAVRQHGFSVVEVTRENYGIASSNQIVDYVVNCAMPSGRFWAKNNRVSDFTETVGKTSNIISDFPGSKIIQISSISARVQLDSIYGRHKLAAEALLDPEEHLVIRLGPLYHGSMTKGALIDIVKNRRVFLSGKTKYAFTPVDWVCDSILKHIDLCGVMELGSKGYVVLEDLANSLNSKSEFEGICDDQIFAGGPDDRPCAGDVIAFSRKKWDIKINE
jgi:nucleoside-diphosphate-sugar epimerase